MEVLARERIAECLGADMDGLRFSKMAGGYLNETFLVQHNFDFYVLWVNREQTLEKVLRQAQAMNLINSKGLPAPTVLFSGCDPNIGCCVLMTHLSGKNLESVLESMPDSSHPQMFYKMGRLLAQIHSICDSKKAGYLGGEDQKDWKAWLHEQLNRLLRGIQEKAPAMWVDRGAEWGKVSRKMLMCIDLLPSDSELCFLHGDFYPGNLLVVDEEITGILDFEWSLFGNQEYDFRVMEVFLFDVYKCSEDFYSGYQSCRPLSDGFEDRISFYRAFYRLELIWMAYELFDCDRELAGEQMSKLFEWCLNSN